MIKSCEPFISAWGERVMAIEIRLKHGAILSNFIRNYSTLFEVGYKRNNKVTTEFEGVIGIFLATITPHPPCRLNKKAAIE